MLHSQSMRAPKTPRKRTMTKTDKRLVADVLAALERARDVINDPATPMEKVYKIGAILEAYKYRRPPFAHRPKSLDG